MGCCNCNCINKLEHVEKVIAEYDPNEKFINYKLLTVWLNRKSKTAWILVSKEGGIAIWKPIPLAQVAIEKIILDCGNITPNEKGEIIHRGRCGARTVTDDCKDFCITVETEEDLTGGGTVCAGEKITLGVNKTKSNLVRSSESEVEDNDLIAFDGTSGKLIKKSDGITLSRQKEGKNVVSVSHKESGATNDAGFEAKVEDGGGYAYFQLSKGDQTWRGQIDPTNSSLDIRPTADLSKTPILSMLPNGVFLGNNQPKASARLIKSTPAFATRTWYQVGATSAFEKFRDEDGYNKSANNFFPGDGNGKGAFYTFPYPGVWAIQYQFILDIGANNKSNTRYLVRLTWGKEGSYKSLRSANQLGKQYGEIADCKLLPIEKDDVCFIEINVDVNDAEVKPFLYAENNIRSIDNFLGFFLVVG